LTEFISRKCKRCGFYEEDSILSDDVFDEWELCPSDFAAPDGKYLHFKEKEFNATFMCPECLLFSKGKCLATFFLRNFFTAIVIFSLADYFVDATMIIIKLI
jgi:hypothetical protein